MSDVDGRRPPMGSAHAIRHVGSRGAAWLSPDQRRRYLLTRRVELEGENMADGIMRRMVIIGLNPSTADHEVPDPTLRRCEHFARVNNCGQLWLVNLFSWRDPKPRGLMENPLRVTVGEDCNAFLRWSFRSIADEPSRQPIVVAAWGVWGRTFHERVREVVRLFEAERPPGVGLRCLGTTKEGHPRHPLYLPNNAQMVDWSPGWSR